MTVNGTRPHGSQPPPVISCNNAADREEFVASILDTVRGHLDGVLDALGPCDITERLDEAPWQVELTISRPIANLK
jgi:hypothetical protein